MGGDPSNDFERYEILAQGAIEPDAELPRDYRFLISVGPFRELQPESTIVVQMAFVAGEGQQGLMGNAASARLTFQGGWLD